MKIFNKKSILPLLLLLSATTAFSVDYAGTAQTGELFFTSGLQGILNTQSTNPATRGLVVSAPSPVLFSMGVGGNIPFTRYVGFSPSMNFYMHYYLLYGERAYPAEIENRTAQTLNFLLDLPIIATIRTKNTITTLGMGLALALRVGFTAQGVPKSDEGDTKKINEYLWQKGRFVYPSLQVAWDYVLPSKIGVGAGLKFFIPIYNAGDTQVNFFHEGMMSLSLRFTLPPFSMLIKPKTAASPAEETTDGHK